MGRTSFNSTSFSNGVAGVNGMDGSGSGKFDSGVTGTSTRGTGVHGSSSSGTGVHGSSTSASGVSGTSGSGIGVNGTSNSNAGVVGSSTSGSGLFGTSGSADGVIGTTHGSGGATAAVQGNNSSTTTAIRANGFGGDLFIGNSTGGIDVFRVDDPGDVLADGEGAFGNNETTSFGVEGRGTVEGVVGIGLSSGSAAVASTGVSGATLYVATNSSNTQTLIADDSGNLTITGEIFTGGVCSSGCVKNPKAPGTRIITYAPHEAAPTVEDVGEGQLTGGSSYVALDPAFASVIDQHANYFVFITPEGDNRGLFVTGKSTRGFSVRESQGGRSTLPFSYRIVAKPYGATQPRLARVNFAAQPRPAPMFVSAHYPKKP